MALRSCSSSRNPLKVQAFSSQMHLHFHKLEPPMCGALLSGHPSSCPGIEQRFLFSGIDFLNNNKVLSLYLIEPQL